jgi:hypothetical protein
MINVKIVPEGPEKDRILKEMQIKGIAPITFEQLEAFLANPPLPSTALLPKPESSMPADTTK